jgi:Protein of unknown function (DUF2799)
MATLRYPLGLFLRVLISGCATHSNISCVGDAETLGFHDGSQGQRRCASHVSANHGGAYDSGWNEGIQRFCTEESGYQQGCQGAAFTNVCPDPLASAYLDGYQEGYAVYLVQTEIEELERTIELKSTELEQIWSMLDAVANSMEQSDLDSSQRQYWIDESQTLAARQSTLEAELDELESDISARKSLLEYQRHAIAIND